MTLITVDIQAPTATGNKPAAGYLVWSPTKRRYTPTAVVLPAPFTVRLVDGKASFTVDATTAEWLWRVDEVFDHQPQTTIYLTVHGDTQFYADLALVDPVTLEPFAEPSALWWETANATIQDAALVNDELVLSRYNGEKINLGNVRGRQGVRGPKGEPGTDGTNGVDGANPSNAVTAQHITEPGPTKTALSATYVHVKEAPLTPFRYGAQGDGVTDDTAAIDQTIAALPAPSGAFGTVNAELHFPAGRYIDNGSRSYPGRVTITGDGPNQTLLYRKSGASGDYLTLSGSNSQVKDLTVDGNRYNGVTGDNIVLNAGYTAALNLTVMNAGANGITVGKTQGAIAHRIEGVIERNAKAYGVFVVPASGSTDGMWSNSDFGLNGLTGVRIENGAQNIVNVHTWGNGHDDPTNNDANGFYLYSANNLLVNCQAETNRGSGFLVNGAESRNNRIVNGKSWGNRLNGLRIINAPGGSWVGGAIYNNGTDNAEGNTSSSYASIRNEGGTYWIFSGSNAYDDAMVINPTSYPSAPAFPFMGRAAGLATTSRHYVEAAGTVNPDQNTFTGNIWRSETTRNGVAIQLIGRKSHWEGNNLGAQPLLSVAAGATLFPQSAFNIQPVTGAATITSIDPAWPGRRMTLLFMDAAPGSVTDGGNLRLAGNFAATQYATLDLMCDGTNWYEVGRTLN